jgi:hypothetical protein
VPDAELDGLGRLGQALEDRIFVEGGGELEDRAPPGRRPRKGGNQSEDEGELEGIGIPPSSGEFV